MWYFRLSQSNNKKMYILRGLPGSGKSTKANEIGANVNVFGSDSFWGDEYDFDESRIGEAHRWNQKRVLDAINQNLSPIVVDNTNVSMYEFKPYVQMAIKHGYDIEFVEPDTPWKFDANELASRNKHNVPLDVIQSMLDRWDSNFTIDDVLNSTAPWEKTPE